jgi:hypothetical protein
MCKFPYLFRRGNVYYFRFVIPVELRNSFKVREIILSLKTEVKSEAIPLAWKLAASVTQSLKDLKTGKIKDVNRSYLIESSINEPARTPQNIAIAAQHVTIPINPQLPKAPLLSFVVDDFLKRYDQSNKATLTKLKSTLPILIELVGDKVINQIFQTDLNRFFDEVQKLPVRRDAGIFKGMSIRQIIEANTGSCISQGTFKSTYRACVSLFIEWAKVHYSDQGFPDLCIKGAVYRGTRAGGVNKQRAMKFEELQVLFGHRKMKEYSSDQKYSHYCWLPLIGLHTGARINEICQLNPSTDIVHDVDSGVHYFNFTDLGETGLDVKKSIKTNSSRRIVPIHSKLIDLGFLDYVERIKSGGHKILFPEWQPRNGKASANASKWFVRYLESIGLSDDSEGARLSGFHSFRFTFVTFGIENKISGVFSLTGHESEGVDGFEKMSAVSKGYWTRSLTDGIVEKKANIEKFDFSLIFYQPK